MYLQTWSLEIYVPVMLYLSLNQHSASPAEVPFSRANEVTPQTSEITFIKTLVDFFNPKTCDANGKRVEICSFGEEKNKTICISHGCCHSKKGIVCYQPLKDNVQFSMRIFGIGMISVFLFGCFPLCGCWIIQKSRWCKCCAKQPKEIKEMKRKQKEKTNIGSAIIDLLALDAERKLAEKEDTEAATTDEDDKWGKKKKSRIRRF
ncbi:uncharacterized protein LOC142467505 [Ascaphus truei]|uniref:uncharacterized protein LOC142467505 n=1 Tax=Ascaphus truei TaxID=8439 RepID=UPI003F5961D7